MSPDASMNGWHSTDDEQAVPVRSSLQPAAAPVAAVGPAHDISHSNAPNVVLTHPVAPNPATMRLSAFLGIALVLVAIGFYFGFGSLTGDLLGTKEKAVSITAAGEFSPTEITLYPGDTLTITNENPNPQVIKGENGRDLFPVQVIFDKPYSFTVPETADGVYVYFSETLPEGKKLTINVLPAVNTGAASSEASAAPSDIPLPFGDVPAAITESSASSVAFVASSEPPISSASSSAPAPRVEPTVHSGESATISIGGETQSSHSSAAAVSGTIPTNPYTVASGKDKEARGETIASAAQKNLHSGAPLQIRQHKPKTVTDTGPAGTLLMLLPALFAVGMLYRKLHI